MEGKLAGLARHLEPLFMQAPPDMELDGFAGFRELLGFGLKFRGLRNREIPELIAFATGSLGEFLDRTLESPHLKSLILANSLYGKHGGPYDPGTLFGLLFHLLGGGAESKQGFVGHVMGGMGAITQAMAAACRGAGVELRANVEVAEVRIADGRATGVVLTDGSEIDAGIVVSNAAAIAIPTPVANPWPSGPVVVLTPGVKPYSGWPGSPAFELAEIPDLIESEVISHQMEQRIEQHGAVPPGKDKPVTTRPFWVAGIVAQMAHPQGIGHGRGSHGQPGMSRIRLLDGICGKKADGVDCACLEIFGHKKPACLGCFILPSAHRGYNQDILWIAGRFDLHPYATVAEQFTPRGRVLEVHEFGNGNFNDTYLVTTDSNEESYFVLQRINTQVFRHPRLIMQNMRIFTEHMRMRARLEGP